MDKCEYLDILVNGTPLSSFGGSTLLDFSVGETPLTQDVFQGVNRTSWNLLKTRFGMRPIALTIVFRGKTLHEAKLQRSRFNGLLASGKIELFIPQDGFYYSAYVVSLGSDEIVGIGDTDAAIKSAYTFEGIRHGELRIETLPAGATMFCLSTMPQTDCRMSTVLPDDPGLPTITRSGTSIQFDNSTGYYFANPFEVSIPANLPGTSAITLTQTASGEDTRTTQIKLGKAVYGGSVEAVSGILTETHTQTVYDPENIPTRLTELIRGEATRENVGGLGTLTPLVFSSQLGQYPFSGIGFNCWSGEPTFGETGFETLFYQFRSITFTRPDGTSKTVDCGSNVYGAVFYPLTGEIYKATYYASYNGEQLTGPWIATRSEFGADPTPETGETVIDFGATSKIAEIDPEVVLEVEGSNSIDATTTSNGITTNAYFTGTYYHGSLPSSVLTANKLKTGQIVTYLLETPQVSQIDRTTISLIKAQSVTMTTNTGSISATLSSALPEVVSLGGAGFHNCNFNDVITIDGITGAIEKNGQPAAASTDWLHFPSLTPGENVVDAQIGTVTVEYYPTYI